MSSWPFYSALRSQLLSLISVQPWNESLRAVGFVIWSHYGCKGLKSTLQLVPSLSSHPSEEMNPKKTSQSCVPYRIFLLRQRLKRIPLPGGTAISTLLCDRGSWWRMDLKTQVCKQSFAWWPCVFGDATCPLKHNFPNAKWIVLQLLSHVQLFVALYSAAYQAPLSSTTSQSLLKLMSIELMRLHNHFLFYCPLVLMPSIFPSIRVFSQSVSSLHQVA